MKSFFQKKGASIILLILISIEIFYVSSLSFGPGPGMITIVPFTYHVIVFFLFSFFTLNLICSENKFSQMILSIILSLICAILDEVHQIFVPFRGAGAEDILIDSLGIFSAAIFFLISRNYSRILKLSPIFRGRR